MVVQGFHGKYPGYLWGRNQSDLHGGPGAMDMLTTSGGKEHWRSIEDPVHVHGNTGYIYI